MNKMPDNKMKNFLHLKSMIILNSGTIVLFISVIQIQCNWDGKQYESFKKAEKMGTLFHIYMIYFRPDATCTNPQGHSSKLEFSKPVQSAKAPSYYYFYPEKSSSKVRITILDTSCKVSRSLSYCKGGRLPGSDSSTIRDPYIQCSNGSNTAIAENIEINPGSFLECELSFPGDLYFVSVYKLIPENCKYEIKYE